VATIKTLVSIGGMSLCCATLLFAQDGSNVVLAVHDQTTRIENVGVAVVFTISMILGFSVWFLIDKRRV